MKKLLLVWNVFLVITLGKELNGMNIFLFLHVVLNAERDGLFYAINNKINKNNRLTMKKLLLILLCLPFIGFGQQTYVPDDNFEAYLEANGMGNGIANDDSVLTSNINNVSNLDVSNQNISDLTGIEGFYSLEYLHWFEIQWRYSNE